MKKKILKAVDSKIKRLDKELDKVDVRRKNYQSIWWENYGRYKSLCELRKFISKLK